MASIEAGGTPSGGKVTFRGTANILQARDKIEQDSGLESMAAFHRWRMASLKTQYARQLRGILADVHKDEQRLKEAQSTMVELKGREASLSNEASKLRVENSRAAVELERFLGDYDALEAAFREACDTRDTALARAEAAESTLRVIDTTRSSEETVEKSKLTAVRNELEGLRAEQAKLLDSMAERDSAVASMGSEAKQARSRAAKAQEEVMRMEGVVRSTGERAAVAESRASELEVEIASLREAVRHDYSERRRLQAAGEELEDVKKQLASASAVNATLAEGRRELRDALDATSQRLAASEGRNGALEQAASYIVMLERVFEGTTAAESLSPALRKLGVELDNKTKQSAEQSAKVERLNAVVSQRDDKVQELKARIASVEGRNMLLEDAAAKNRRLQVSLDDAKDAVAEEKSLRVAAEHRATSLASQNSLKDYILKVRAKTANEDVSAALERINTELDQRTEDAAALAGRASLAESRLESVTALQAALASKISELETLRASGATQKQQDEERGREGPVAAPKDSPPLLPGSIQGPVSSMLVPQEALEASERRRADAEQRVAQIMRRSAARNEAVAVFMERVMGVREHAELVAVFSRWRAVVSMARMDQYLAHSAAKAQAHLALASLAGRGHERTFQARANLMFIKWRLLASGGGRGGGGGGSSSARSWARLALRAMEELSDGQDHEPSDGLAAGLLRIRRLRGGGFFVREVSELQAMRLALSGWRTHVKDCKLEDITAALPLWIARIGEKRCLERHWMAWRIAAASGLPRNVPRIPQQQPQPRASLPSPSQRKESHPKIPPHRSLTDSEISSVAPGQRSSGASRPAALRGQKEASSPSPFPSPVTATPDVRFVNLDGDSPDFTIPDNSGSINSVPDYRMHPAGRIPSLGHMFSSSTPGSSAQKSYEYSGDQKSYSYYPQDPVTPHSTRGQQQSAAGNVTSHREPLPQQGYSATAAPRSVSAPPQRAPTSAMGSAAAARPAPTRQQEQDHPPALSRRVLRKGSGSGGRPNQPRSHDPLYFFGHHVPEDDRVAQEIAHQEQPRSTHPRPLPASPPARRPRSASVPPSSSRGGSVSPGRPPAAQGVSGAPWPLDDPPVVQAFGSTVSHDPTALRIALHQPLLRDLEEPDAVPILPTSLAGHARQATAVERVVGALAETLSSVATSLAAGTVRADHAVSRLASSPAQTADLRRTLVQHGLTGPTAVGPPALPAATELSESRSSYSSISSAVKPHRPRPERSRDMEFVSDRAASEHVAPRSIAGSSASKVSISVGRPQRLNLEKAVAVARGIPQLPLPLPQQQQQQQAPEAASHHPMSPHAASYQRQALIREAAGSMQMMHASYPAPSPAKSAGGSPAGSPRSRIEPPSPRERGVAPVAKLQLPGTRSLSPREKREFENILTSGATGFSPKERQSMEERAFEMMASLEAIPEPGSTGSDLVIPSRSGLLRPTEASEARRSSPGAGSAPSSRKGSPLRVSAAANKAPTSASSSPPPAHRPRGSPGRLRTPVLSSSSAAAAASPSTTPQPTGPGREVASRLMQPTAATINRALAVQRSLARREAAQAQEQAAKMPAHHSSSD